MAINWIRIRAGGKRCRARFRKRRNLNDRDGTRLRYDYEDFLWTTGNKVEAENEGEQKLFHLDFPLLRNFVPELEGCPQHRIL
jgi:hypothetical protein